MQKNKTDLLIIIVITILISVAVILFFVFKLGLIKLEAQVIRLLFTCILSYFLYQENQVARWIYVVLFYLAGGNAIYILFELPNFSLIIVSALGGMALFYIASATYLAFKRNWKKESF